MMGVKLASVRSLVDQKIRSIKKQQVNGNHRKPLSDTEDYQVTICLNCGTEFKGNYCPNCGQRSNTKRLNWQHILHQSLGVFTNLERGFVHTCVDLFYRPGYLMRDYINGKRVDYNNPLSMLFVLATLHLIIHYIFYQNSGVDSSLNGSIDVDVEDATLRHTIEILNNLVNYLASNQGLLTLVFVTFLVLPNWLIFKFNSYGKTLNIVEHCYLMLFVGCQLMIFNILQIPYNRFISGNDSIFVFSSAYSILFSAWDVKQLFQIGWLRSIFYIWLSSIIAFIMLLIIAIILITFYILVINPELKQYINS